MYRAWKEKESQATSRKPQEDYKDTSTRQKPESIAKLKLSFKEKNEFEAIEKEIPQLQKEKTLLEEKMNTGTLGYDELQKAAQRISSIVQLLDEKEMRWLELSERMWRCANVKMCGFE